MIKQKHEVYPELPLRSTYYYRKKLKIKIQLKNYYFVSSTVDTRRRPWRCGKKIQLNSILLGVFAKLQHVIATTSTLIQAYRHVHIRCKNVLYPSRDKLASSDHEYENKYVFLFLFLSAGVGDRSRPVRTAVTRFGECFEKWRRSTTSAIYFSILTSA